MRKRATVARYADHASSGSLQVARVGEHGIGSCADGSSRVGGAQVDAQGLDDSLLVVLVETIEDQTVVQESRRLLEDLAHHRGVDLRPRRRDRLTRGQQQVERGMRRDGGHEVTMRPATGRRKRLPVASRRGARPR